MKEASMSKTRVDMCQMDTKLWPESLDDCIFFHDEQICYEAVAEGDISQCRGEFLHKCNEQYISWRAERLSFSQDGLCFMEKAIFRFVSPTQGATICALMSVCFQVCRQKSTALGTGQAPSHSSALPQKQAPMHCNSSLPLLLLCTKMIVITVALNKWLTISRRDLQIYTLPQWETKQKQQK
jgi:hypothetical protein